MIFLVTSHFRNSHPQLGGLIFRQLPDAPSHPDQYDAGEIISIGQDPNGKDLTADQLAKKGKCPEVVLIGHLNQGGRLLDPIKQPEESSKCLTEAAAVVQKQVDALVTQARFLDERFQEEEIEDIGHRIHSLKSRKAGLLNSAKAMSDEKVPKEERYKALMKNPPLAPAQAPAK
jgi:hypothetical protein